MSFLRRVSLGLVLLLIAALTVGSTSAATGDSTPAQHAGQTATTPAEICTAADIPEPETRDFEEADDVLQDGVDYWAVICTEEGPIYLDLFEERAPITVNNFVFLAQQGYYNNTTFHRVLAGFMAQGGDPSGTGSGGPGYEFGDETDNGLGFDRAGLLAMANAGPGTNGSQFFITYAPTTWLDGNHTIFGEVFQGIEVAERLKIRDPQMAPNFEGAALETVVIVDDPASVSAEPDGAPSLDHLQYMLENVVTAELNTIFVKSEENSHVYDLDAEAESYAPDGGDELVDYLRAYLSDHGFLGTAAVYLPLSDCPSTPEELPVWLLGFQIADYGTSDAAEKIVTDEDRAAQFVETGAADASEVPMGLTGRMFSTATDPEEWCGPDGTYYRLEYPYGRYIVVVDLVLDDTVVNEQTEPNPVQFLASVMDDFLLRSLGGTLDRGNAVLEE